MTLTLLRHQQDLAPAGAPDHVLTRLGHTSTTPIVRADLDAILNSWVASTGGTIRTFTSAATFTTAIAAALPGDLIRCTSSFTLASGTLTARGNLYNIAGTTLTASPAGGTAGLPIIITCTNGVTVTGSGISNGVAVLDIMNNRHVLPIGFNVQTSTFGIRLLNAGGAAGAECYAAYNWGYQCRDATLVAQGWFQLIASSGGTPPAGDGNTWGFSEHIVFEENDCIDPNPTNVAGNPGEGIYLGRGGAPGWFSAARHIHVRGNRVTYFKANGVEAKAGCTDIYIYDNDIYVGRGQLGSPIELCYQAAGITSTRPAWMPADPRIWCESNRIWDFNLTVTGTTWDRAINVGIAGCRIANNLVWSVRDSGGGFGPTSTMWAVVIQSELSNADFGDTALAPSWIVNNLFWCRGVSNLGGTGGPITGIIQRNNIVPAGYSGGQFEATVADFVGPVPVPGTLSDAAQAGGDPGTGWELATSSPLHGQGASISDLDLLIPFDPSGRIIPASGLNPGPFQPAAAPVVGGPGQASRFESYTAAALPGTDQRLVISTAVDLIDPLGALKATTDAARATGGVPLWAVDGVDLQLDPDRVLSRTVSVTVSSAEVDLVPDEAGSLLHPETGNRVRVVVGLEGGPSWTLATLLIEEAEATAVAGTLVGIALDLVDPGRPLRSNLIDPVPWAKGEAVEAVVARLLAIVLPEEPDLAETGWPMPAPGSFAPGRSIADLVGQLLGGCGHELTADENGRIYSQPIPPTKGDAGERWLYGGPGRLPVVKAKRRWSIRSPQGVLVKTGSLLSASSSFDVPVWDLDPGSQGHYSGPGEVKVEAVTYDHLGSARQAVVAGYGRLRRIGVGPGIVVVEIAPNPAMRPGDLVDLQAGSVRSTGLYRVVRIDPVPTVPDKNQVVTLRAVWDPELGYTAPADPGIVCTISATDPFDRPNENLENKLQSPGSPLWTEHAYSWAVVGQVAIQRHNGTASLARYNVPMCGLDYVVRTTLADVFPGKWIGPAARSSGQFDCYAAVVDSVGRIRLELWQAGRKLAQLAEYSTNTDPSGKKLDLACDGSEIIVVWEGLEVIGKTDTRRSGVWAGMHGLGGIQGQTAPGIAHWSAELL